VTTTLVKPGRIALFSAYTPIGYTSHGPVYPVGGGRSGGGFEFIVGDDGGDDPEFDDEDHDDDDDDDDNDAELPASMRARKPAPPKKRTRSGPADQDDDSQGDAAEGDDGWAPPTQEAWENMEAALGKANREAARRRRVGKVLDQLQIPPGQEMEWFRERGIDPDTGRRVLADGNDDDLLADGPDEGEPDQDDDAQGDKPGDKQSRYTKADVERAAIRAENRATQRYEGLAMELAAENAIRAAGWNGTKIETALRFVDAREIEVTFDDEGRAVFLGLDEQVDDMKAEFPDWFRVKKTAATSGGQSAVRRRTGSNGASAVDGGDRGRSTPAPVGWLQQASQQIDGRTRRR
jgi:hypothetical protein